MDMAFIKALNMSISASWLVLVVLALRILLKKTPKWVHVALWALVAVRLICPISIESAFSLVPSTRTVPEEIFYAEPPLDGQNATLEIVEPRPNVEAVDVELDTTVSVAQTRHVWWVFLWPAGMVVMALHALISYFRLKRKVSASLDLDNGVFLCDYIDTPFILGIIKPRIYLPSSMEPDSASHVLAHERAHIARKDHWWKPFGYLLLAVYWFNPVLWMAYILLCRDIELACDEKVIRDMEVPEKKAYSEALLACSVNRRMIAACPLAFGEVGVKERVKTVLNYKKPAFWIVLVAILALIVTALCFLTDPVKQEEDFGKIYQVEKVVYRNTVLSYYMTEENAPQFQITEDNTLRVKEHDQEWKDLGQFSPIRLSDVKFDTLFLELEQGQSREEKREAWLLYVSPREESNGVKFYLLWQESGGCYIAEGMLFPGVYTPHEAVLDSTHTVNWLYRLKDTDQNANENQDTPFGSYYRVNGTIYRDAHVGSFSASSNMVYLLTPGRGLSEMEHMGEGGINLARFTPTELTEKNFLAWMAEEDLARELLAENMQAWEYHGIAYPNPQANGIEYHTPQINGFLYLLQQQDGQIFLVTGNDRNGEYKIGNIFKLEKILSDDPFAESSSPYQWMLNIRMDYVEKINVTTHKSDGTPLQTDLTDSDILWFLSVLNGVSDEEITFGHLAHEPYIWAEIVCGDETVELAYDKDAVSVTFPESAAGRYPAEAGNTWIITNDALISAMFAYHCYSVEDSPFSQPDRAYHWCRNIDISLVQHILATDTVTVENRYDQAFAIQLNQKEMIKLLDLLKELPEGAFEKAEYPQNSCQSLDIRCRNVWTGETPWMQLHLLDGNVYCNYLVNWDEPHQSWKINSRDLAAFISAFFTGDHTGWDVFAPIPKVEGELTLEMEGIKLIVPRMSAFIYEITDAGLRFRPEGEEGWVCLQYSPEPFAVCGTGLKTMGGYFGSYQVQRGYYDDNEYWSFININMTSGDMAIQVQLINENGASWVEEYEEQFTWMIHDMAFQVSG